MKKLKKSIRKIYLLGLFAAIILAFSSCRSTKNANKEVASENEDSTSKDEKVAKDSNSANDSKNESGKSGKRNYIGWVDASTKDVSFNQGIIQLKVKPNLGSYNISVLNEKERAVSLLATGNEFTSSSLYLKTAKKTYKLLADTTIKTAVTKKEKGVIITYVIPDVAEINLDLDCLKSSAERDYDILKTTISATNKGKKTTDFTFKQILDTILGETGSFHFYDYENIPVKTEIMYRGLKKHKQKWFVSKNNSACMQMFFTGGDATEPELFALANFSTLDKKTWEPDMNSVRTFDTVLSYNNSAVGVIWPTVKLAPEASSKIVYYFAFATDGAETKGQYFVYGIPEEKKPEPEVEKFEKKIQKTPEPEVQPPAPVQVQAQPQVQTQLLPPVQDNGYSPKNPPDVTFNVDSLSKEKYTQEYIQSLLTRISELEKDSASVNREELLQLNKELDEILSALKE